MTFFTLPPRCFAASARLVKSPVDSMTTSAPTESQGICAGSRSEKILKKSPLTLRPSAEAETSAARLPNTESCFSR